MNKNKHTVKSFLKLIREVKGYTQDELSVAMGVPKETISSWERGKRNPSRRGLDKLTNFFHYDFVKLKEKGLIIDVEA